LGRRIGTVCGLPFPARDMQRHETRVEAFFAAGGRTCILKRNESAEFADVQERMPPVTEDRGPARALPGESKRGRGRMYATAIAIAALLAVGIACGIDAIYIEPFRIQVTRYELQGNVAAPLKIADLSDVHTHGMGRNERRTLQIFAEEKPDLIVVTGDCLGNGAGDYRPCERFYQHLHAPLGVWVVRGNWENDRPVYHERAFYAKSGVHLLVNQSEQPRPDFALIGLDDPASGNPRLKRAMANVPAGVYKIALFHAPAYFDHIAGHVNLCIAGHTHGGQVIIPFVHPFWLPKGSGRFLAGWYEEDGTRMYVNRGLGMSDLPIRFLCRPEITFFSIEPAGTPPSK